VEDLGFMLKKECVMYSKEFMKFLINYQTPEYNKDIHKHTKTFKFEPKHGKLATVLLLNKK
jgi:hypothetical protein